MLSRKTQMNISLAAKESQYDSAATLDELINVNIGSIPQENVQVINDQDLTGGKEEATDQEVFAQSVSLDVGINRVKPTPLLWVGAYGLGAAAAAAADSGTAATKVRQYACTPVDNDGSTNSFTFEFWFDTSLKYKYTGGMINSFSLSVQQGANRFVSLNTNIIASGTRAAAGSAQTEHAETQLNAASAGAYLLIDATDPPDADIADAFTADISTAANRSQTLAPGTSNLAASDGTVHDIASRLRSATWDFSNNISPDDNYRIGGGKVLSDNNRGGRTQTLTLELDHVDDDFTVLLKNQYTCAFQMIVQGAEVETGYYEGFDLIFPRMKLQSVQVTDSGGNLVDRLVYQILEDSGATYKSVYFDVFADSTGRTAIMA